MPDDGGQSPPHRERSRVERQIGIAEALTKVLADAIASCVWIPGKDPQGRPVAMWVILPVRISVGE